MALTPQNNEAFLREVDEELRKDQAIHVWRRWGRWIVGAIVLGLAIFAGVLVWQNERRKAAGRDGEQLQLVYDDLTAQKTDAAAKPLEALAASSVDGYRAAALFTQADVLLRKDDLKGAAAKFASVAGDGSLAQPYRDIALIRQTAAEFDALPPDRVVSRLKGLAVPGNPWFGSAGEMVAVAYLKQGKRDLAGKLFGQIAQQENVPASLRQRAVQMAGVLGVDAVPANRDGAKQ